MLATTARSYRSLIASTIALAVGLTLVLAACSGAAAPAGDNPALSVGGGGGSTDQYKAIAPVPAAASPADAAAGSGGTGSSNGTVGGNDVSRPDLLVIKTGSLELQVAGLDDALARANAKIAALGGYSSGSQRSGDADKAQAVVTYRIPAASWDDALVALRGMAARVISEQTQTQDVTGQVIDLGARITNLQATEKALQAIMAKATKISDVLAVQGQLTDVRGQIEELTTEKTHLEGQAAFSTLTVTWSLKPAPAVTTSQKNFDPAAQVDQASAALVGIGQALATLGIWFGIVGLPVLFGLAILGIVLWLVARRMRRSTSGSGSVGGPGPIATAPPA